MGSRARARPLRSSRSRARGRELALILGTTIDSLALSVYMLWRGWDWDIEQGPNAAVDFTERCYRPYWHNSQHLIPNGVLRQAIDAVGKEHIAPTAFRSRSR